jgi:hypothetical protein
LCRRKNVKNHEQSSSNEDLRKEKQKADEAKIFTREQSRTQAYLAREQEIEKALKVKEAQRTKDMAEEEIREQAKEKARKEIYQARERKITEDQEARKLKNG